MKRVGPLAVVAGIGLAIAFSACGDGAPSSSSTSSGPAVGTVTTGATAVTTIKATDALSFSPNTASAKVGDVVEWDNSGSTTHNVTFTGNDSITDTSLGGGQKYQVKFTVAGTYPFVCTIHSGMSGTLTVTS